MIRNGAKVGLVVALVLMLTPPRAWAATRYKLETVPQLANALSRMRAVMPKVGQRDAPTSAKFREAAVMLVAADVARKAGALANAKTLAGYCVTTLDGGAAPTVAQLKVDNTFKSYVGTADGKVPGGENTVWTEAAFAKGLEQQ